MALEVRVVIHPGRVGCDWVGTLGGFWGAVMIWLSIRGLTTQVCSLHKTSSINLHTFFSMYIIL